MAAATGTKEGGSQPELPNLPADHKAGPALIGPTKLSRPRPGPSRHETGRRDGCEILHDCH